MAKTVIAKKQNTKKEFDFSSMTEVERQELLENIFVSDFRNLVGDIDLVSKTSKTSVVSISTKIKVKNAKIILDTLVLKRYIDSYSMATMTETTKYGYDREVTQEITVKSNSGFDLNKLPEKLTSKINAGMNSALARLGF